VSSATGWPECDGFPILITRTGRGDGQITENEVLAAVDGTATIKKKEVRKLPGVYLKISWSKLKMFQGCIAIVPGLV